MSEFHDSMVGVCLAASLQHLGRFFARAARAARAARVSKGDQLVERQCLLTQVGLARVDDLDRLLRGRRLLEA
jgi:hypothetical protein